MIIIHKINSFLNIIFPDLKAGSNEDIINAFKKYYAYGPYTPIVKIDKTEIIIEIDTKNILNQEGNYRNVVSLCEKGKFQGAKLILTKLIESNPTVSEYHRIMGQILSGEGDQEEAINCLIDALRWDSNNSWALLMMGNIFAKFKDDVPTAMNYYDQALVANPEDNITMNNIGANLMQDGKIEEAKKYFYDALSINDKYANTHFALGLIAEIENDLQSSFYSTIKAIKLNNSKDELYQNSVRQAFSVTKKIISTDIGKKIFRKYRHKLEFDGETEISIIEDSTIPTVAKIEFAENYDRDKHILKYKPNSLAYEHLIMHELVHLDYVIQAKINKSNKLFTSNTNQQAAFKITIEHQLKKLSKLGLSQTKINEYCSNLFDGLNSQVFNTPIDLLIENYLYAEYVDLRPYQFISLYTIIQQGVKAVTDKNITELSPKDIVSKSKIYNIVSAFQFKELFGIDFITDFKATGSELKQAQIFYDEYLEYQVEKQPGEEYELIKNWAKDLSLDKNFELINEEEFRTKKETNIDNILSKIEKDPFDQENNDPFKKQEMETFLKSQESIGTNMAVTMFMIDALNYFENKSKEEIKKIAFEIAMLGTQGYSPEKKDYKISSIPNVKFSGYHILAYYYVSWAIAIPEMVSQIKLPYDNEYSLALSMHKTL